ncbi:SDR family NAD(P)-dependent oxidoreductase [Kitasatospora cineracea]|uniref:NAD(P)-dependent dehydrogenase (Short-subunit alcohol dehydrogenase family) n=1 Tax=Kitasatospora cineracea TaxID=88074 RepID=A0A3N4RV67_9ACTN|nr:SDR family NAD(P)-dependent oxidoreductase [Kitasatospora cineracea]ROR46638.1 NAD(P)-dependent dehydrogenase (short-subunit alcohol dehydrogenase family) [Kitasatospora cineracea]RPE36806.1 NAD(P)-dependent dehydrogenase (short-subunit alcohol dehydrogenase family) [Kitasatospora cineracea]
MDLTGNVALITGGTRGIGLAIAHTLHAHGARLLLTGRSERSGRAALDRLGGGPDLAFHPADATVRAEAEGAVDEAVRRYGHLDVVVNNVGGATDFATVADITDEVWHGTFALNLDSALHTTRRALAHLLPQRSGRIVNIASVEGRDPDPGLCAYAAAKHALIGLTRVLAKEVGGYGVTANCVCPGAVETDWFTEQGPRAAEVLGTDYPGLVRHFTGRTVTGRLTRPDEVAAAVLLLASPAGAGITGACIPVDGGATG